MAIHHAGRNCRADAVEVKDAKALQGLMNGMCFHKDFRKSGKAHRARIAYTQTDRMAVGEGGYFHSKYRGLVGPFQTGCQCGRSRLHPPAQYFARRFDTDSPKVLIEASFRADLVGNWGVCNISAVPVPDPYKTFLLQRRKRATKRQPVYTLCLRQFGRGIG